jgi:predicted Rossmann fold flavoprotein
LILKLLKSNSIPAIDTHSFRFGHMIYDLIVIGGGAAGFFGAIQAAEANPTFSILIVERSNKLLAKVKISGGGRCNVTHHCFDTAELSSHYPRGAKPLRQLFKSYSTQQTIDWFKTKGVVLKAEADGRMFPITDSSQTVIDCFMQEALRHKIKIEMGEGIISVVKDGSQFKLFSQTGKIYESRNVIVATGGNPNIQSYDWLCSLGHTIRQPIPSLFTFNDSQKKFADLMGVAVPDAEVKIAGTKLSNRGPLLITHWGLSGPAVIRLSAWAAEYLHEINYQFTALVSWVGPMKEDEMRQLLLAQKSEKGKQKIATNPLFSLPQRLWTRLCELSEIGEEKIWAELPQKNLNKLLEHLIRCPFEIKGKTTFKEEFVTCGGVDLKEIDLSSMQSRLVEGLYFAGEVLNIDGETGGFNFQAAWSTSYVAARAIAKQ